MALLKKKLNWALVIGQFVLQFTYGTIGFADSLPFEDQSTPVFEYATPELWRYVRIGLTYLESPKPLAPPEAVPPAYVHPDSKGYGPYGFTSPAYIDVQRAYPFFRQYSWEDILCFQDLYDLANQAYADLLLKNLQEYLDPDSTPYETFNVLQQAWNLGLRGFKSGRNVVSSRIKKVNEYRNYATIFFSVSPYRTTQLTFSLPSPF
ncbi:MAG: hypothetical protein PHC33_01095 [Candidatus Omnitrophica bacterium]|nr:hypothetical protein [Candidatus Omnitrophota bacterium]